jgi:DNA-binding HxlR family transcriptional regulator
MQARCENLSPNTLSIRLSEMKESGLIEQDNDGLWQLSPMGRKLQPALIQVNDWAHEWINTKNK